MKHITQKHKEMEEQQLIDGVIRQDRRSQRMLYERFAPLMMSVCFRYVNDYEVARDLLQDGFVKVFNSIGTYQGAGSFEGWVRRVFSNLCLEYLRKNDVLRDSLVLEDPSVLFEPDYSMVERLSANELMEIVAELPTGFRTVFNMYAIEGYSHKEIGDALGITESTSRSQFTRARQYLQKKLHEISKGEKS